MWLNNNEAKIIEKFIKNENLFDNKLYKLTLSDGSIVIVTYEDLYESCNCDKYSEEDPEFEEFYEILFKIVKVIKKSNKSVFNLRKNRFLALNYHNFPTKIEKYENN